MLKIHSARQLLEENQRMQDTINQKEFFEMNALLQEEKYKNDTLRVAQQSLILNNRILWVSIITLIVSVIGLFY